MQYQLPNGKVIYLSVEQYLDLTDQDIQDLIAGNCGDYSSSPWEGSAIKNPEKKGQQIDKSIDYQEDSEEPSLKVSTVITYITIDDVEGTENSEEIPESEEEEKD